MSVKHDDNSAGGPLITLSGATTVSITTLGITTFCITDAHHERAYT